MGSPFLYFADDRLSTAELSAACLDGHLVELGEAYIPADAVETAALRGGSLARLLGDVLAATHLSAAWVHGALPVPPSRHTVQRAVPRRLHHLIGRRFQYRDLCVAAHDLDRIGGVLVTTPARTLADLSRVADRVHRNAARLMVAEGIVDPGAAIDWLERSVPVPHKRQALALLRGWAVEGPRQDEVTRYTS
ncbi:MAG: hypothetical protein J0I97_12595 [Microbacterium sp.]|nr:hypothetical protein [Microbacterium sp.]MBN9186286.1 hypothetical protein [Microbacterium sp.]